MNKKLKLFFVVTNQEGDIISPEDKEFATELEAVEWVHNVGDKDVRYFVDAIKEVI